MDFTLPEECYPVILVTASKPVPSGYRQFEGFMYVQGAADDEEAWSHGLKSIQFWDSHIKLLACSREEEVVRLIKEIVGERRTDEMKEDVSIIAATGLSLGVGNVIPGRTMITCGARKGSEQGVDNVLYLHIPTKGKPVTALTQQIFPQAVTFALNHGILNDSPISILAIDSTRANLDLSISITLVLLSLFFNDNGTPNLHPQH
jgi:tRNA A64-2'-O-ribosylphosphate transferase